MMFALVRLLISSPIFFAQEITKPADPATPIICIRVAPEGSAVLPSHVVSSLALSPDGKALAAGCRDQRVRLYDPHNGRILSVLDGHLGAVTGVTCLRDGLLASSGVDGTVLLWQTEDGKLVRKMSAGAPILSLASSSRGSFIAAGCSDRTLVAWDGSTGTRRFSHKESPGVSFRLACSPDGKAIAAIDGGFLCYLWDAATGKKMRDYDWGNPGAITLSVTWSPDGKRIAGGVYGSVRLWDVETGAQSLECFGQPAGNSACFNWSIAFSTDGTLLASASDDCIRIWDARTGNQLEVLKEKHTEPKIVLFAPAEKLLVSSDEEAILVWDLSTLLKK